MRDEGVIYVAGHSLLNRRCTRLSEFSTSEMTYIVSGGALNSTHLPLFIDYANWQDTSHYTGNT